MSRRRLQPNDPVIAVEPELRSVRKGWAQWDRKVSADNGDDYAWFAGYLPSNPEGHVFALLHPDDEGIDWARGHDNADILLATHLLVRSAPRS